MTRAALTPEQTAALEHARQLAQHGIPVFVAYPDNSKIGYRLPPQWQNTTPNPAYVDAWRPGMALCAVMGRGLDLIDIDPRNGGDKASLNGATPTILAAADSPSAGTHWFVKSLGVRSRDSLFQGIDIKAGVDGEGHGFAFIPPTVRPSKVTGELVPHRWTAPPYLDTLHDEDGSGHALAALVNATRTTTRTPTVGELGREKAPADLTDAERAHAVDRVARTRHAQLGRLRACDEARTPGGAGYRGEPWDRTTFEVACHLIQLANSPWADYTLDQAHTDVVAAAPTDDGFTVARIEDKFASASRTVGEHAWPLGDPPAPLGTPQQPPPADLKEFWTARPTLGHIHTFARARRASPWAALGVVLARVVTAVRPSVVLPPTVGGHASLNLFIGLVGPSGGGKGAAEAAGEAAVDVGPIETLTPGSGEGIAHGYMRRTKDGVEQHTTACLFTVAEIDTLAALSERRGATLLPELRRAWMGERLGFGYADPAKRLPVPAHQYRMTLVAGIQPARAGTLIYDSDGGTPQRFLWLPVHDRGAPEHPPAAPDPLRWSPPRLVTDGAGRVVLPVCDTARRAVDQASLDRLRGDGDALDGHALLVRLKVAAALALLDGRLNVSEGDWTLAGTVMAVSDHTRATVVAALSNATAQANKQRGAAEAERTVIVAERVEEAAAQRAARAIARKLAGGQWATHADLRRGLSSGSRALFDEAIERLILAGQVESETVDDRGGRGTRYRAVTT